MKSIIPFKKVITFDTKIASIVSISLEHNYKVNDDELSGNFLVFGDYKIHELSVNTEPFKYSLPFQIELSNIIEDSLDFQILDFTYDVIDEDKLEVFIEFSIKADQKEEIFEKVEDELPLPKENSDEKAEEELDRFESREAKEEPVEKVEERMNDTQKEELFTKDKEDTYIKYHIHIVAESETLESIIKTYNITDSKIKEYNNIENLAVGDKLLIPEIIDE